MSERANRVGCCGFTLIEMILAMGVMAIVIVVVHAAFFSALQLRDRTTDAVDQGQPAQQAATFLRRDLLCATASGGVLEGSFKVGSISEPGMSQPVSVELCTATGALHDSAPWAEIQKVTYALDKPAVPAASGGRDLVRRVTRNLLNAITPDVTEQWLMGGVQSLEFDCFDGAQWVNTWDTTAGNTNLPVAVRVRIEQTGASRPTMELVVPLVAQAATNSV